MKPEDGSTTSVRLSQVLQQLDQLVRREIGRLRAHDRLMRDELQGLYISDERVDQLCRDSLDLCPPCVRGDNADCDITQPLMHVPTWARLTEQLSLNRFERSLLVLALAPEVDLKYETLYGYLNNDVTRKGPTRELALRLFTPSGETAAQYRHLLAPQAPLFRYGILRPVPTPAERPSWLSGGLMLDPAAAHYLLEGRDPSAYLAESCRYTQRPVQWDTVPISLVLRAAVQRLPNVFGHQSQWDDLSAMPLIVWEGRSGAGQEMAAAALAHALDTGVLHLDLARAWPSHEQLSVLFAQVALHQLLYGSLVLVTGIGTVLQADATTSASLVRGFYQLLERATGPVIVSAEADHHHPISAAFRTIRLQFDTPTPKERAQLWSNAAASYTAMYTTSDVTVSEQLSQSLADRFILTPHQIHRAWQSAMDRLALVGLGGESPSAYEHIEAALFEAARAQTRANVPSLAMRTPTTHTWTDLVLPDSTLRQVREVASAIRYRTTVYDEWEFARRLARGRGLTVLFSGVSGTGKTMAAAIIAKELGVDLYTIELSSVVSKYIGETEKNLDRIFRAAHHSNAILFFDEADALFGKRSEVKDAHDRYANIEVAYLLQKMEEHEGAVILATNLSRNIDPAFTRRIQYVIEFPVPGQSHRERLWRGMFPPAAPLGDDVDFPFLAQQFEIAGGDIRNVALDAAFLAAQNGRVVTMQHLVTAMARQVRKQGRTPAPTDFKHYFALITRE